MELTDRLYQAFNSQYVTELTNSDFYLNLSQQAESLTWDGFAKYLLNAAKEEQEHAHGFATFLIDRNRVPKQGVRPAQTAEGQKPLDWITLALEAERANTKRLLELHTLCGVEKDIDAQIFLQEYIVEQRKGERELTDWVQLLKRSGSNAADLLLDKVAHGA